MTDYDSECERLARHFYPGWSEQAIGYLAMEFQCIAEEVGNSDDRPYQSWLDGWAERTQTRRRE